MPAGGRSPVPSVRQAVQGVHLVEGFAYGAMADARHAAWTTLRRARGVDPANGAPVTDADPLSATVLEAPERWYADLHAAGPVNYCPRRNIWVINGYEAVREAGRAHDVLSSAQGTARFRVRMPMLVTTDRPDHARLRRILARDFTKKSAAELTGLIRDRIGAGLDRIAEEPEGAEAYEALAAPVPLEVIQGILGVPDSRAADLRRWSDTAVTGFMLEIGVSGAKMFATFLREISEMYEYFDGVIDERRAEPGNDAISRLVGFEDDEGALTNDEVLWFILLLLVAGNETTTSVIMALVFLLATEEDQWAALKADPELIPNAVEEAVRWASPVPNFFRTAKEPYTIGDVTIPADSRVMLSFAAGNRDPAVFDDPDRFDVMRDLDDHVGFGSGIHFCLGSHLARLELKILLELLVERVERLEAVGPPTWRENASLRGIERLMLRLHPASAVEATAAVGRSKVDDAGADSR